MSRIGNKIFAILWSVGLYFILSQIFNLGLSAKYISNTSLITIIFLSLINLIFEKRGKAIKIFDIMTMYTSHLALVGLLVSEVLIQTSISISSIIVYSGLSSLLFIQIINSMYNLENSMAILLTLPILIFTLSAQFLVALIDIIFPPKFQELVPYIEVTREMIFSMTQILASDDRIKAEEALDNLGSVSGRVDEIADGYALRKGLGQGIDLGLTAIVFIGLGVLQLVNDTDFPPELFAALFASLGLALSTFAGFFGPFYGLAGAAKQFTLKNGNYRGASIYKAIEQLFAIPFMAASAGFLFLDLPPIDADTLEDFKSEMQEQIDDISDNINSLLGTNSSAVPRKTRKMIASLITESDQGLSKLDFRNIRKETNREFALTYYQYEFSWKPWKRKSVISQFSDNINFDLQGGEDALKLIGFKIKAGQLDDDLVNNVMVSAALRGVIMMEQKYQEIFEDVELGQTCTGLAFGARQFLEDHYIVRSKLDSFIVTTKNFFMGIFAVPIVIAISFHNYFNRMFDELVDAISDIVFENRGSKIIKLRTNEVYNELVNIPENIKNKKAEKKTRSIEKSKEAKAQRNWQIKRNLQKLFSKMWEVLIFPVMLLVNIGKWILSRFTETEQNARELFEEAVSHAALLAMYEELYKKLILQTHLSY